MLRLLPMLLVLLTVPHRLAEEAPPRDPRHPFAGPRFAAAVRVSGAVRDRFALAAEVAGCRLPDNLYGFDLLLAHFPGEQRLPIELAAREGASLGARRRAGAATLPAAVPGSGVANCAAADQGLRAADDRLVLLAEQAEREAKLR